MSVGSKTIGAVLTIALSVVSLARAEAAFPDRSVTIVVGFDPGGGTDQTARLIARKLSDKWGQPVLVENRSGADGTIGTAYVAHSNPDGYTLLMADNNYISAPSLHKLTYDPQKDFAPITLIGTHGFALEVTPSLGVKNFDDFIALVRANPLKYFSGTTGPSSAAGLAMTLLAAKEGLKVAPVNYKGTSDILVALLSDEVQMSFNPISAAVPQAKAGKLQILAVSTPDRSPDLPQIPTVIEAAGIPGFDVGSWDGLLAPAATPPDILKKIHDDAVEAIRSKDLTDILMKSDTDISADSPEQFAQFMKDDFTQFNQMLQLSEATQK